MAGFGGSPGLALMGEISRAMKERKAAEAEAQENAIRMRLLQAQTGTAEANLAEMPTEAARRAETHSTQQRRARREETEAEVDAGRAGQDRQRQTEARDAAMSTMSDLIRQANPGMSDDDVRTRALSAIGGGPDVREEAQKTKDRAAQDTERASLQASRNVTTAMNQLRLNTEREAQARDEAIRHLSSESFFRKHVESAVRSGESGLPTRVAAAMAELGFEPDLIQEAFEVQAKKIGGVRVSTRGTGGATPTTATGERLRSQQRAHSLIQQSDNDPIVAKQELEEGAAELVQRGIMTEEEIGIIMQEIDQVILNAMRGNTRGGSGGGSAFEDASNTSGGPVP